MARERFDKAPTSLRVRGSFFTVTLRFLAYSSHGDAISSYSVLFATDHTHAAMIEPKELIDARRHLSRAEAALFSKDAVTELEDGLDLLQDLAESGAKPVRALARTIAKTYASKCYDAIRTSLASDRNVPEPTLEHLLRIVLVFDEADADLPDDARDVKIALGRTLLNRYLEGHAPEEKRTALAELMSIAEGSGDR